MELTAFTLLLAVWFRTTHGKFYDDIVRSQVVDVQVRRTRSYGFEVKLSAFGEDLDLRLRRSEPDPNKPVFSPNFTMLMMNADEDGESTLDITPTKEALKASEGNVFVDPKAEAALHLSPNANGKYQVKGFLGQGRSISSQGGVHEVSLSPYVSTVPDYEDKNRSVEPLLMQGRSWAATMVQAEVVIVVDYLNSQLFKDDPKAMTDYFSIFFHSVNNRYATLTDPKISFVITGVLQMNSTAAQPFLENNKVGTNGYEIDKVLDSFSTWVFKMKNKLPKFDLATLITGNDLYIRERNGNYAPGVNGRAYINGACWFDEGEKKFMGTSVIEDMGGFWDGAWTLAHELGHNLGAYHDGEGEAADCDKSLGHIMSYEGWGHESKFLFSRCSIKTMSAFLKSTGATCLKNFESVTRWTATAINIGDRLNFTVQCQKHTKNPTAFVDPKKTPDELCRNLVCRIPDPIIEGYYQLLTLNKPPADGSPCDVDKKCLTGHCVEKSVEEQMERDRLDMQKKLDLQPRQEEDSVVSNFKENNKTTKPEGVGNKIPVLSAADIATILQTDLLKPNNKPSKKRLKLGVLAEKKSEKTAKEMELQKLMNLYLKASPK